MHVRLEALDASRAGERREAFLERDGVRPDVQRAECGRTSDSVSRNFGSWPFG